MISMSRTMIVSMLMVFLLSLAGPLVAGGQSEGANEAEEDTFPSKAITVIVGSGPGGSTDVSARALAAAAGEFLNGVAINVVNMPGATGMVGAEYVTRQPADGYTLYYGWGNLPFTFGRHIQDLPINPLEDLKAVSGGIQFSTALTVPIDAPYQTVDELVSYAKANPGQLKLVYPGTGGGHWLIGEDFLRKTGIDVKVVPNDEGGAAARNMVAGGHADLTFLATFLGEQLRGDKLRMLAVQFPERDPLIPDVPTFKELGYDVIMSNEVKFMSAPAGVPDWKIKKLSDGFVQAMEHRAFTSIVNRFGLQPLPWGTEKTAQYVREMDELYKGVAEDMGMTKK